MKKVCCIYTRISTADKHQDHNVQLKPLQDYVKSRGWELYEIYSDTISSSYENRPALNKLMQDAHKRLFSCVIVFRFDRLGRSIRQLVTALDTFRELDISLISYNEQIDTDTITGRAMFGMISIFSELEKSVIQERVKFGLMNARAKGKKLGRPKAPVDIEKLFQLKSEGLSIRKIAGVLGVPKSTIQNYIAIKT